MSLLVVVFEVFFSRSGKNCNHSHSREEVLYHPTVYKTSMCDTWNCSRYYCPFAHSVDEIVSKPSNSISHSIYENGAEGLTPEEIRLRQLNFEDFWEDNDFDDLAGPNGSPASSHSGVPGEFNELMNLQMRRVVHRSSGVGSLITTTNLESTRLGSVSCLPVGTNTSDPGWVTLTQGLRVELVVRAISPLTHSELCMGTVRAPWETGAASNSGGGNQSNRRGQQQASMVVKIIPVVHNDEAEVLNLMNQLQSIARADHKNILSIKKVHLVRSSARNAPPTALAIAYERCSTSLYSTVVDGYRHRAGAHPRGLAGRLSAGRGAMAPPTSATVGKVGELLSAMQRFHSQGIAHCRICPSNIFIDADANLKLGDCDSRLGLFGANPASFLTESVAAWLAPEAAEVLATKPSAARTSVDWKRVDMFGAGLSIFFALTGQHAFATFADEEKSAAAGAANLSALASNPLFAEGRETLLSNIHSSNIVNQHLLYSSPLVLDLILRMLIHRTEVSELLTHPMFWDFYSVARFVTRLPWEDKKINRFCETCPVPWTSALVPEEWALVVSEGGSPMDYKDTVWDLLRAIRSMLTKHKASGCVFCCSESTSNDDAEHAQVTRFVSRVLAKFPAAMVRAWDASRLPKEYDESLFKRNHLSWMSYPPRSVAQPDGRSLLLPSHAFVREYYVGLVEPDVGRVPDESSEIFASIVSQAAAAAAASSPKLTGNVEPAILASMVNSFGAMLRSDMLPPGVPREFVMSLIEAAGSHVASSGVYYSTVGSGSMKPLLLPSVATTAVPSPAFTPSRVPREETPKRRMSDGWEYAVACPPTMQLDCLPLNGCPILIDGDGDDESPPPGFRAVWQSMADDGL